MPLLQGPLVYLTDGAPASLELFPEVAAFAQVLGSRAMVARVERSANKGLLPDQRFVAALHALDSQPEVLVVSRRQLGADLAAQDGLRGGALVLQPRHSVGLLRQLMRESRLPLLALPGDDAIGTVRRVLFPADFAPRSLPVFDQAITLCHDLAAELVVLHVYGNDRLLPSEIDIERRMAAQSPLELFNIDKEQLAALVERANQAGVQARSAFAEGRAHTQILRHVSANPIDLVVMPTHGPRTIEDVLQGTTTTRVVQRAPVPVLVVRS